MCEIKTHTCQNQLKADSFIPATTDNGPKASFPFVDKTKCKAIILSAVRGNTVSETFLSFLISHNDETFLKTPHMQYRDREKQKKLQGPKAKEV